jgi:hypothetical protein
MMTVNSNSRSALKNHLLQSSAKANWPNVS